VTAAAAAAEHPAPARHVVGLPALWFGLFGAPVAWTVQELASSAVIGHSCFPHWRPLELPSIAGTWVIALIVSILTLALGAAAALVAWRSWQRTRAAHGADATRQAEVGEGRARFMALSGLVVSGLVLYNMVLNLLVLFFVPACG
jgi:hypothetical protein